MPPRKEKDEYPMRINRYLAREGVATRRGVDELIEKRRIYINGRVAVLGDKVNEDDVVEVRGAGKPKAYKYFAYHKPKGVITHSPQEGEPDIKGKTRKFLDLADAFPVGRLDKSSSGLIILTNDGRVTDRLLSPTYDHDKEYVVKTREPLRESFKKYMEAGIDIEGYVTKKCSVRILGSHSCSVVLTEGKKHQLRRMVVALHNEVVDLKRVRIVNIVLGNLPPNSFRPIEGAERETFLKTLGL